MSEGAPNLICKNCISLLRQASGLKEILHNTALFWEIFLTEAPPIVETIDTAPLARIKEELDDDSLMRETIYLSSSYQQDDDDKDDMLRMAGSDVDMEFDAADNNPEPNVLNSFVKKEGGFCNICYTGEEALLTFVLFKGLIFYFL